MAVAIAPASATRADLAQDSVLEPPDPEQTLPTPRPRLYTRTPRASLHVITAEPGRRVWIDGRYVGLSPVTVDSLRAGPREVAVGEAGASLWYKPWRIDVILNAGAADTARIAALELLSIRSHPAGAMVRIDSHEYGRTPIAVLAPVTGATEIELHAPGYRTLTLTVATAAGIHRLERLDPERIAPASDEGAWSRRARAGLPIFAVLGGVAGVTMGRAADRAYTRYERSLNRSEMQRELDRAHRYDRLGAASLIAGEVCLAAAAWLWLRHSRYNLDASVTPSGETRIGVTLGASPPAPARAAPISPARSAP